MNKLAAILAGAALIAGPALSQPPAGGADKPAAPAAGSGGDEQAAAKPPATGAAPGAAAEPATPKPEAPEGTEQGSEAAPVKQQDKPRQGLPQLSSRMNGVAPRPDNRLNLDQ